MEEPKTWRELLGQVTSDYQEKQRIAEAVGVNPITLMRWATNKSNPRLDNLRPLLSALPQHRQQLAKLIAVEYPHILNVVPTFTEIATEIPSVFYARVLNAHTTSPPLLRGSVVSVLILQQLMEHLDPQQLGMVAVIVQCMLPLAPEGKVRSLRKTIGRGNPPWSNVEHSTCFVGAEGQAGRALTSGRLTTIQTREEKLRLFPTHHMAEEESTVAYPILLADRVAGCLCISSTRRNYFTQVHLDLIQSYVNLLVLAFEDHEFYPLQDIELGIMPPARQQQTLLASFQRRVTQLIIKYSQDEASRDLQPMTRMQAEQAVWREMEAELLR